MTEFHSDGGASPESLNGDASSKPPAGSVRNHLDEDDFVNYTNDLCERADLRERIEPHLKSCEKCTKSIEWLQQRLANMEQGLGAGYWNALSARLLEQSNQLAAPAKVPSAASPDGHADPYWRIEEASQSAKDRFKDLRKALRETIRLTLNPLGELIVQSLFPPTVTQPLRNAARHRFDVDHLFGNRGPLLNPVLGDTGVTGLRQFGPTPASGDRTLTPRLHNRIEWSLPDPEAGLGILVAVWPGEGKSSIVRLMVKRLTDEPPVEEGPTPPAEKRDALPEFSLAIESRLAGSIPGVESRTEYRCTAGEINVPLEPGDHLFRLSLKRDDDLLSWEIPLSLSPVGEEQMPHKIDPGEETLPPDLIEGLAEYLHGIWAQQLLAEGWTYGAERHAGAKRHPFLLRYEDLPEPGKEIDRQKARDTLRTILGLGFQITPK